MHAQKIQQFDYTGRRLIVSCDAVELAGSAAIVVPTSRQLTAQNAVTQRIYQKAGTAVQNQIAQLRREYSDFDIGMAVYTDSGDLTHAAIVHAVGYSSLDAPETNLIEQAYTNSLLVCEFNSWHSIAFERLYDGEDKKCAHAAARAIIRFWDARLDSAVETVLLCVPAAQFNAYIVAIEAINSGPSISGQTVNNTIQSSHSGESLASTKVGVLDLSDNDLSEIDQDSTISDWFSTKND